MKQAELKTEAEITSELKAYALKVASELPERLLKGDKVRHKATYRKRKRATAIEAIEQSYDQLDGQWRDWLEVARRYEHKVPSQDRLDIRHNIMVELHRATNRDGKPLPLLRAYRIASLTVALYWREQNKASVKVCVYSGLATEPHCKTCSHRQSSRCAYLASRPIQSLDSETLDSEGNKVRLMDTVADDHAIDLDAWLDNKTFLLGCPMRLIEIARKRKNGIPLNDTEQRYFTRQRQKELKRYQIALI